MADFIPINPTEYEPEAPLTSSLGGRMVNNPVAIAEGAPGAPRIQTDALNNSAVTTPKIANSAVTTAELESSERMTTANVIARTAGASAGAVGTYAMLGVQSGYSSTGQPGTVVAGSQLRFASTGGDSSAAPAGSWRCMGAFGDINAVARATLFLRIS